MRISSGTRTIAGAFALSVALTFLALRVHALIVGSRIELTPRTRQLAYVGSLIRRVDHYAIAYGRPVYQWNLNGYLSPAESTEVEGLRAELYRGSVYYTFNDKGFYLRPRGDPDHTPHRWRAADTNALQPLGSHYIAWDPDFPWPRGAATYALARRLALTPKPIPGLR